MAAPAATINTFELEETFRFEIVSEFEEPLHNNFLSADFIPELNFSRHRARIHAEEILEANRELLREGQFASIPLPVDPLGTSQLVLDAKKLYGEESEQYQTLFNGLILDCHRLLGEAFRAKTWEYFQHSEHQYDHNQKTYYSNGTSIAKIVRDGLSPVAEKEEQDRRVNEYVEEIGTYQAIGKIIIGNEIEVEEIPEKLNVTTVSLCPDWAIDYHKSGSKEGTLGYVPEIQKFMIRNVSFNTSTGNRNEEQVALSGLYIDQQIVIEGLRILDSRIPENINKTQIQQTQIITEDDVSVWDYVELFDELATIKHGKEIFMGEVHSGGNKDYIMARQQAVKRAEALSANALDLTYQVLEITEQKIDNHVANFVVQEKVKEKMLAISSLEPDRASEMFDDKTAIGFKNALTLEQLGDLTGANNLRIQIAELAPDPPFCGAGSCGLEAVKTIDQDLKEKLQIENGDKVVRDIKRACSCGKKSIVYAYTKSKVNKLCQSCGAFESKKT